jgi:hypothetical protein
MKIDIVIARGQGAGECAMSRILAQAAGGRPGGAHLRSYRHGAAGRPGTSQVKWGRGLPRGDIPDRQADVYCAWSWRKPFWCCEAQVRGRVITSSHTVVRCRWRSACRPYNRALLSHLRNNTSQPVFSTHQSGPSGRCDKAAK